MIVIRKLPEVKLPLSMLRAIRQGGLMRPQPSLFADDLETPPANNDLIYVVRDGQARRSAVSVSHLTDKTIEFELRGEAYDFDLKGLAAVVFGANTGFPPDRQPRPRAVVALTTGERLEGKSLSLGETLRCRLDEGFVVEVPMRNLHKFDVSSDKLVWLSELRPEVVQTPAFDRVWPWHVDRSTAGPGFDLAGRHYERGIGLVPYTKLTYTLDGRFDVFEAKIGIDDRGGPAAHAIFRVLVDGKPSRALLDAYKEFAAEGCDTCAACRMKRAPVGGTHAGGSSIGPEMVAKATLDKGVEAKPVGTEDCLQNRGDGLQPRRRLGEQRLIRRTFSAFEFLFFHKSFFILNLRTSP